MTAENYSAKHELQKNDILLPAQEPLSAKLISMMVVLERQYSQAIVFDFDLMKIK